MKEKGVDSPSIWAMSTRNLGDNSPQMVQKTSVVLTRGRSLGLNAGL